MNCLLHKQLLQVFHDLVVVIVVVVIIVVVVVAAAADMAIGHYCRV